MNKGFYYAGRASWYVLRTVIALGLCVLVFYYAFTTAMNLGSVYVIATEGMELRADVALGSSVTGELSDYFYADWLNTDPLLNAGLYDNFKVTSYNYTLRLNGLTGWGWSDTGTATLTERVTNLVGNATDGSVDENGNTLTAPAWVDNEYLVTLKKDGDGRWRIASLEVLAVIPKPTPSPTPTVAPTETPAITPAPVPTPFAG